MVGILVTSAGLLLSNAEYLWVRSYTSQDVVHVVVGSLVEAVQQSSDRWLHFGQSSCEQWDTGTHGCSSSELQVELRRGVECDLFAWAEAADRREPVRAMIVVAETWPFDSGDINLNGVVDCEDSALFHDEPYDWDLDGAVTVSDLYGVSVAVSLARADLNHDGVITDADMLLIYLNWGACPAPPQPCPWDLDCDGQVGINDLLRVIGLIGA